MTSCATTSLSGLQKALRQTLGEPQPTAVPLPQPAAVERDMAQIPQGIDLGLYRPAGAAAAQVPEETQSVPVPTRLPVRSRPVAAT